jgi:hypothetical protein
MQVRERGAAGHVKQQTIPAKADLTADGSIPIRLHHSHISELCVCSDELLGIKEKLVLLKLLVLAADRAAVPLEASFQSHNEVTELQIESGLSAANRFTVRFAVSGNMKCGETVALSHPSTAFGVAINQVVELLSKIDVSGLFAGVEVIETPTDINADVKPAPVARIDRGLLERFQNIVRAGSSRGGLSEENRGPAGYDYKKGANCSFHPWPRFCTKCRASPSKKGGRLGSLADVLAAKLSPRSIALSHANGAGLVTNVDD